MTPGELDQLIDFKRKVLVSDGMGGQTQTINNLASGVWAKARAMSGREVAKYDQLNATAMVTFITRYRTDIKEADYIVWNGANYNIRYIQPNSARDLYTVFEAEKGLAL
jgi:SPP1 family predicted phage head-tail adaptor